MTTMIPRYLTRLMMTVVVILVFPAVRTQAQFGYGFGYGFNYQPPEIGFINSKSLLNASQATMGPTQNNVYANNPNAYINHLHDDGYLDKYDVGTRRSIEASIGRFSDGPPPGERNPRRAPTLAPTQVSSAPASPPSLPLVSFFDRYQHLIWPAESPKFGKFEADKSASDLACLAVLNEFNLRGLAQLSTVTEARAKVLEYGRPALEFVRENTTTRVADSFHLFLLSLYESLAQAATTPKTKTLTPNVPKP